MVVKPFQFGRWDLRSVLVAVVGGLISCAHAPPPPCSSAEPLRISLHAAAQLNPSENGDALATVVRVYQLKGTGRIGAASFDDLLDHDKDTLGEDFIGVQEVTVSPGTTLDPPLVRNAAATHVAVVALFRKPTSTSWRAVEKLPPPDPQHCHAPPPNGKGAQAKNSTLTFQLNENRIVTMKTP